MRMFEQKEYDGQDFAGLKEPEQQMEELKFHDCRFDGGDFSESVFKNCSFENAALPGPDWAPAVLSIAPLSTALFSMPGFLRQCLKSAR